MLAYSFFVVALLGFVVFSFQYQAKGLAGTVSPIWFMLCWVELDESLNLVNLQLKWLLLDDECTVHVTTMLEMLELIVYFYEFSFRRLFAVHNETSSSVTLLWTVDWCRTVHSAGTTWCQRTTVNCWTTSETSSTGDLLCSRLLTLDWHNIVFFLNSCFSLSSASLPTASVVFHSL